MRKSRWSRMRSPSRVAGCASNLIKAVLRAAPFAPRVLAPLRAAARRVPDFR